MNNKFLYENNTPIDVFFKLTDHYRDLLVLLEQARDIISMQPINEMLVRHGEKRISETTVSVLGELIKDTKAYKQNLLKYHQNKIYENGSFHNFMALELLPKYRGMMINGLRVLYERAKNTRQNEDRIAILSFIQEHVESVNQLLIFIRDISATKSINTPFRDYVERFGLQDITTDEIISSSDDGILHNSKHI